MGYGTLVPLVFLNLPSHIPLHFAEMIYYYETNVEYALIQCGRRETGFAGAEREGLQELRVRESLQELMTEAAALDTGHQKTHLQTLQEEQCVCVCVCVSHMEKQVYSILPKSYIKEICCLLQC